MMSAYTCITCRVQFVDAELQRAHYKTDWHRYNLKRKVAELPPVTAESFKQRVQAQRAETEEADESAYCDVCSKHFSTKNQFNNHKQSKKHKEAEARHEAQAAKKSVSDKNAKNSALKKSSENKQSHDQEEESGKTAAGGTESEEVMSDTESVESWDGEALGVEECLFCPMVNDSLEHNILHMSEAHSFFIPDMEYLADLEGLVQYLGEKVGEGHICLWCNEKGKSFYTTKSVQQHMVDKGHCKMLYEGDVIFEYSDFYDYRSSYPDHESEDAARSETPMEEEAEVVPDVLDDSGYQLVLPSGNTLGHRSLQRYYRQKLRPDRPHNRTAVSRVIASYKALGWTGCTGSAAVMKAKDIAYIQRLKSRQFVKYGMKANKFQPHFRDDNFGIRR